MAQTLQWINVNKLHVAIGVSYFVMLAMYALIVWRSSRPIASVPVSNAPSMTKKDNVDNVVISMFGQKDLLLGVKRTPRKPNQLLALAGIHASADDGEFAEGTHGGEDTAHGSVSCL